MMMESTSNTTWVRTTKGVDGGNQKHASSNPRTRRNRGQAKGKIKGDERRGSIQAEVSEEASLRKACDVARSPI